MRGRTVTRGASLLLFLGGCAYVALDQIPCREDSDCPNASHCGLTGYCAVGTALIPGFDEDAGDFESLPDAGAVSDGGSPTDEMDSGTPADEMDSGTPADEMDSGTPWITDAGFAPDAGFWELDAGPTQLDAGAPFDAGRSPDAGHAVDAGFDAGIQDAGPATGSACLDTTDATLLSQSSEQSSITSCAENNINYANGSLNEPQAFNCIEGTGLSAPCTKCVDAQAQCILQNCAYQCAAGTNTSSCQSCTNQNCTPAFNKCSGL